ncbi:hypothetical protein COW36_05385 [bacterium (Candidatus Blackallbacteria) CG17_big_fil_post_rev_8_21_14_2_50_48_46]|uniref:HTH luxR-type domain-containing protein n=1 Tax=bacterium (Candidatus Blackallbacteria) CG17_big_fil_post_rev_8_21_14_2_50_48_46 TaxID=2014261 RepID=A0A2M7G7Z1_9BACT|nr:MAG: hypothetical protein COW64_20980 [bacterium (Candidatus Blackallbacteria) CG18_big_fil_WC_8_21_14_2_50_49_26]PIW18202.1 MAG: hypothetical protein COW36_05385 [bacterium (Candidatus Blackallbacteria) CG17_big_fil_post_rev_8_21_14_2_50_48_46]PIW50633.1 MAG: hypothetical protein COW20_01650 [bacterium (Candidatus Blackallbacteria) CG13_big_fil_rev_8_21_14_2_50_49_14]
MQSLLPQLKVLIAEPHALLCSALKACLRSESTYQVKALADSVPELLKALSQAKVDFVILHAPWATPENLQKIADSGSPAVLVLANNKQAFENLRFSGVQGVISLETGMRTLLPALHCLSQGQAYAWDHSVELPPQVSVQRLKQPNRLTPRENEVTALSARGLSPEAIASELKIQTATVKRTLKRIAEKNSKIQNPA